jgi:hypothetical protein
MRVQHRARPPSAASLRPALEAGRQAAKNMSRNMNKAINENQAAAQADRSGAQC